MGCFDSFAAKIRSQIGKLPVAPSMHASALITVAVLLLGASVFVWGLQCRILLYHESSEAHPISAPRLMQDGQASDTLAGSVELIHNIGAPDLQLASSAVSAPGSVTKYYGRDHQIPSFAAHLPAQSLYFRPPPVRA